MKVSPNIQMIQAKFDNPKLRPSYAHGVEDAGCDLKANITEPLTIEPWKSVWVGTGVHLAMPYGMFALQAPRSDSAATTASRSPTRPASSTPVFAARSSAS